MKNLKIGLIALALIFFGSCTQENLDPEMTDNSVYNVETMSQELLTIDQINAIIDSKLKETGTFSWKDVTDQVLWSATVHGENVLTIGYGNKGESFRTEQNSRLTTSKNEILAAVSISENISQRQITITEDPILNVVDVEVKSIATISSLR